MKTVKKKVGKTSSLKTLKIELRSHMENSPRQFGIDAGSTIMIMSMKDDREFMIETLDVENKDSVFKTLTYVQFDNQGRKKFMLNLDPCNIRDDWKSENLIKGLKNNIGFGLNNVFTKGESLKIQELIDDSKNSLPFVTTTKNHIGNDVIALEHENIEPILLYKEFMCELFKSRKNNKEFKESHILVSHPNTYTNYQRNKFKEMIETASGESNENIFLYPESVSCLFYTLFSGKSKFPVDNDGKEDTVELEDIRNVLIIDQGDSSTNITSCRIQRNGKILLFHSGSCQLGGQMYTSKIYKYAKSKIEKKEILDDIELKIIYSSIENNYKKTLLAGKDIKIHGISLTKQMIEPIIHDVHVAIDQLIELHKNDFNTHEFDLVVCNGGGMNNLSLLNHLKTHSLTGMPVYTKSPGYSVSFGLHYAHALMATGLSRSIQISNHHVHSIYVLYQEVINDEYFFSLHPLLLKTQLTGSLTLKNIGNFKSIYLFEVNSMEKIIRLSSEDVELIHFGTIDFGIENTDKDILWDLNISLTLHKNGNFGCVSKLTNPGYTLQSGRTDRLKVPRKMSGKSTLFINKDCEEIYTFSGFLYEKFHINVKKSDSCNDDNYAFVLDNYNESFTLANIMRESNKEEGEEEEPIHDGQSESTMLSSLLIANDKIEEEEEIQRKKIKEEEIQRKELEIQRKELEIQRKEQIIDNESYTGEILRKGKAMIGHSGSQLKSLFDKPKAGTLFNDNPTYTTNVINKNSKSYEHINNFNYSSKVTTMNLQQGHRDDKFYKKNFTEIFNESGEIMIPPTIPQIAHPKEQKGFLHRCVVIDDDNSSDDDDSELMLPPTSIITNKPRINIVSKKPLQSKQSILEKEIKLKEIKLKKTNPNRYYYNHLEDDEEKVYGSFLPAEEAHFIKVIKNWKSGKRWGDISRHIPGRTGRQCYQFYRSLIKSNVLDRDIITENAIKLTSIKPKSVSVSDGVITVPMIDKTPKKRSFEKISNGKDSWQPQKRTAFEKK